MSDGADWTSTGRLFQSRGPAVANERSLTVTCSDIDHKVFPANNIISAFTRKDSPGGATMHIRTANA